MEKFFQQNQGKRALQTSLRNTLPLPIEKSCGFDWGIYHETKAQKLFQIISKYSAP